MPPLSGFSLQKMLMQDLLRAEICNAGMKAWHFLRAPRARGGLYRGLCLLGRLLLLACACLLACVHACMRLWASAWGFRLMQDLLRAGFA